MNTIALRLAAQATPQCPPASVRQTQQPTVRDTVQIAGTAAVVPSSPSSTPAAKEDRDWSHRSQVAAITAGLVGGAAVAAVVAQAASSILLVRMGGVSPGGFLTGLIYREALPRIVALSGLLSATNRVLPVIPVLGGIAGAVIGEIASCQKETNPTSDVPGSALSQKKESEDEGISALPRWTWAAYKTSMRKTGESVHDAVNGLGDAKSFTDAARAGASAGYAFASRIGSLAGKTVGLVQGAYIGTLIAGMPFTFAPLTAIPVAIVSALGVSQVMANVGGVAAGAVAGAGGAVVGGLTYQITHHDEQPH